MDLKIEGIKKKVLPVLKKSGVVRAGLFGSVVHGKMKKRSDIDILVEFKKGKTLFDLVLLEKELETKLRRDVDVVTYGSVNHLLRDKIMNEEVRIL